MNGITLDPYLGSMSQEDKDKILATNFANIQKFMGLSGSSLLVSKTSTTKQVTTSTTYTNVTAFDSAIRTSGGVLQVFCTIPYRIGASQSARLGLFIDGQEKMNSGGGQNGTLYLNYFGSIQAGSHKVEIKIMVDGGTLTTNNNISSGDISSLFISELL